VERPAGTRPVAFVITEDGTEAEPEPIIAACRDQLARFKVPTAVITVPAFPITDGPNGVKIRLTELRDIATSWVSDDNFA